MAGEKISLQFLEKDLEIFYQLFRELQEPNKGELIFIKLADKMNSSLNSKKQARC